MAANLENKLSAGVRPNERLLVKIAEKIKYEYILSIATDVGINEAKLGYIRQDYKDNAVMQIAKVGKNSFIQGTL